MTAKEAYKLANANYQNNYYFQKEMRWVFETITDAAETGRYCCLRNSFYPIRTALEDLGYKVDVLEEHYYPEKSVYLISWNNVD